MKTCSKCNLDKDIDSFYKNGKASARHSVCKECQSASRGRQVIKPCTQCGTEVKLRMDTDRWIRTEDTPLCKRCLFKRQSKRSKMFTGSKNGNWKGGTTPDIQKFYMSSEWKELRTKVFIRDNYTCRDCNKHGGYLEANHIKPRSKYPDLKLVASNIETLCKPCHDKKKWMVYI